MIKLLSIGSDPEMFLFKKGRPISSVGLVPGSKSEPYKISEHESVQVDNVAIEFNTKPTLDVQEFIQSLKKCYDFMNGHLRKIDPEIEIVLQASVEFPEEELRSKSAKTFGCELDHNAWDDGRYNRPPDPRKVGNLRSCGGHIHLGIEGGEEAIRGEENRLIKLMDKYVGSYASSICGDENRTRLYGKAGAYRVKPYGIEYRTPSISWLKKEETIQEVFNRIHKAIEAFNNKEEVEPVYQEAINEPEILKELKEILI